jgi:hypothetical protein
MPLDKEALKAQLVAQYMAHLDALLEQVETESELDLTAIEELALKLRQNVGQDATQVWPKRKVKSQRWMHSVQRVSRS